MVVVWRGYDTPPSPSQEGSQVQPVAINKHSYLIIFETFISDNINMEATISLILSRHGETEENKLHIMQGQMPGHLSELGKQQAEQLADLLEEEEIDVIVSSDLARSYDTAMAVARRKGLEPVQTPLLREMDWGIYTGKVANEMDFKNLPESVESVEALYKRAGEFLQFLQTNFPGKRILAIGHGGFNRAIIVRIEKRQQEEILKLPIMKNTACLRFSL